MEAFPGMNAMGLSMKIVEGDGNCLFRSHCFSFIVLKFNEVEQDQPHHCPSLAHLVLLWTALKGVVEEFVGPSCKSQAFQECIVSLDVGLSA